MIYLTTGANGAGKTLLTLRDVRKKSLEESRPVYYNGRFELVADFGWKKIDVKDWQTVPDGAIFLFDECHNDFPARSGKDAVPDYVKMLAEHRRRGFDFFLITQHPNNIDAFVRRLIGSPGWHRHLKRASGAPLVSVLEWPSVNENCQKAGAGESGTVNMVSYPKEVYAWYVSTSLDTAKTKIPFRVWVVLAAVVLVPLCIWYAYVQFAGNSAARQAKMLGQAGANAAGGPGASTTPGGPARTAERPVLSRAQYIASFEPRLGGLPHTASRYDELSRPQQMPKPAACIDGIKPGARDRKCTCWSQQATVLRIPEDVCRQIAAGGYFDDTLSPDRAPAMASQPPMATQATPEPRSLAVMASTPILPPPETRSTVSRDGEVVAQMRKREYIR